MLTLTKVENLSVPAEIFPTGLNLLLTNLNEKLKNLEQHKNIIVDYLNYDGGVVHFFIKDTSELEYIKATCFVNNLNYCFYDAYMVVLNIKQMQNNISELNENNETRHNTNNIVFVEIEKYTVRFYILLMKDQDEDKKVNSMMSFLNNSGLDKVKKIVNPDNDSLVSQLKTELKIVDNLISKVKKKISDLTNDETILWINPDKKYDLNLCEIEQFCFQHNILMMYDEISFLVNATDYHNQLDVVKQPYLKFHNRAGAVQFKMCLDYNS